MKMKHPQKAKRANEYISLHAARNLHHGSRVCEIIGADLSRWRQPKANISTGIALNVFVTINYSLSESGIDNFDKLRNERFCRWLRTRSEKIGRKIIPSYKYVREGLHVHWVVHIPDELYEEFCDLVPRWVTSLDDKAKLQRKSSKNHHQSPKGCVDIQKVRSSLAVRRYMLKGINPEHAGRFGIRNPEPQGVVYGRRSGVSRSLCQSARKKMGYKPFPVPSKRGNGKVIGIASSNYDGFHPPSAP